jgi:hypothetical protein
MMHWDFNECIARCRWLQVTCYSPLFLEYTDRQQKPKTSNEKSQMAKGDAPLSGGGARKGVLVRISSALRPVSTGLFYACKCTMDKAFGSSTFLSICCFSPCLNSKPI